jgi:hypothetical protein
MRSDSGGTTAPYCFPAGRSNVLRLEALSAVFTRRLGACMDLPHVALVEKASAQQRRAPASQYTIEALSRLEVPSDARIVTISGPPSEFVHFLEPIRQRSRDGRLMGPDLARRLRRLHPNTIPLSLQNQVAASISMEFGLTGPCMNLIEGATAFADVLRILEPAKDRETALLVMSSAADRSEQRGLTRLKCPDSVLVEGAICFLFSPDGELGCMGSAPTPAKSVDHPNPGGGPVTALPPDWPHAPCLQGGMCVLWALASGMRSGRFRLSDGHGYEASFNWQRPSSQS